MNLREVRHEPPGAATSWEEKLNFPAFFGNIKNSSFYVVDLIFGKRDAGGRVLDSDVQFDLLEPFLGCFDAVYLETKMMKALGRRIASRYQQGNIDITVG